MPAPVIQSPRTLANLLLYVVAKLNDMGRLPSTIQLVKFMYLIELAHQRSLQRRLTNLRWVHHFFGPYAFELDPVAGSLGFDLQIEAIGTPGRQAKLHKVQRDVEFPKELEGYVQSIVDRVLTIWGLADTREIVDYVYAETEPMIGSEEGDELDFSKVEKDFGAYELRFNLEAGPMKLRERSGEYPARVRRRLTKPPDQQFMDALNALED